MDKTDLDFKEEKNNNENEFDIEIEMPKIKQTVSLMIYKKKVK